MGGISRLLRVGRGQKAKGKREDQRQTIRWNAGARASAPLAVSDKLVSLLVAEDADLARFLELPHLAHDLGL